jgi:hypothetical protein
MLIYLKKMLIDKVNFFKLNVLLQLLNFIFETVKNLNLYQ